MEFTNTDRSGGIFRLNMKVTKGGLPYNGPATVVTRSDDRVLRDTIYFNQGEAIISYSGFKFGVWRKEFESTLTVQDKMETIHFKYK